MACFLGMLVFLYGTVSFGQSPNPVLNTVFPPGGQAGTSFDVSVSGSSLGKVSKLLCNHSGISFTQQSNGKFLATISRNVMPGAYEVRAYSQQGLSSPRTFTVGIHKELIEVEPNDDSKNAQPTSVNHVINGRIAKGGDVDQFQFSAKRGQRVILDCQAERIDSRLRGVLELYNSRGQRLAVNRGYFGIDPLISFRIPADGKIGRASCRERV